MHHASALLSTHVFVGCHSSVNLLWRLGVLSDEWRCDVQVREAALRPQGIKSVRRCSTVGQSPYLPPRHERADIGHSALQSCYAWLRHLAGRCKRSGLRILRSIVPPDA